MGKLQEAYRAACPTERVGSDTMYLFPKMFVYRPGETYAVLYCDKNHHHMLLSLLGDKQVGWLVGAELYHNECLYVLKRDGVIADMSHERVSGGRGVYEHRLLSPVNEWVAVERLRKLTRFGI